MYFSGEKLYFSQKITMDSKICDLDREMLLVTIAFLLEKTREIGRIFKPEIIGDLIDRMLSK